MGRAYSLFAKSATVIASGTLTSVRPPASGPGIDLLRCWVGFEGAATSAQEGIQIARQPTAFSTLTSLAGVALNSSDPASGIAGGTAQAAGTSGVTASAEGAGTKVVLWPDSFNVLNGWLWVPTPKEVIREESGGASAIVVNFTGTPSVLTTWTYGMIFEEV